jgi:hypothetical protein
MGRRFPGSWRLGQAEDHEASTTRVVLVFYINVVYVRGNPSLGFLPLISILGFREELNPTYPEAMEDRLRASVMSERITLARSR